MIISHLYIYDYQMSFIVTDNKQIDYFNFLYDEKLFGIIVGLLDVGKAAYIV